MANEQNIKVDYSIEYGHIYGDSINNTHTIEVVKKTIYTAKEIIKLLNKQRRTYSLKVLIDDYIGENKNNYTKLFKKY